MDDDWAEVAAELEQFLPDRWQLAAQASLTSSAASKAQAAAEAGQSNAAEIKRLNAAIAEQNRQASERGNALNRQVDQAKADLAQANAKSEAEAKKALELAAANQANVRAVAAQQKRAAVQSETTHAESVAAVKDSAEAATSAAAEQTDVARQGATDAHDDARRAQELAKQQEAAARNSNLVQFWGFAAVLAGIIAKLVQDRFTASDLRKKDAIAAEALLKKEEIAEGQRLLAIDVAAKAVNESEERYHQIHTLVNSNLTAAITSELQAREALYLLLEASADKQRAEGKTVSDENLAILAGVALKIAELKTTIADRNTQTELAARLKAAAQK